MFLRIFNYVNDFMVFGPNAPGAHGTLHFLTCFEKNILWFGTYLEVLLWSLGVQGTPQLKYFV